METPSGKPWDLSMCRGDGDAGIISPVPDSRSLLFWRRVSATPINELREKVLGMLDLYAGPCLRGRGALHDLGPGST